MSALNHQEGGNHYKGRKYQPMSVSIGNGYNACQHTALKYIDRYRTDPKDTPYGHLCKAIHTLELLMELEGITAETPNGNPSHQPQPSYGESEAFAVDLGEEIMDAIYRRVDEAVATRIRDATPEETVITTVDIGSFVRKLKGEEFINTRNRDFVEGSATYGLIKDLD